MIIEYITEAFLLGLAMGSYCTLSCAPFVVPYILSDSKPSYLKKLFIFLQFLLGRFVAYMLVALIISLLSISSDRVFSPSLNSTLLIIASLLMIAFSFMNSNTRFCPGRLSLLNKGIPALTGFIVGLNLCPPFVVAIANILNFKSILLSCAYFFFLFIGTTIYILPVVFVSAFLKNDFFRRLGIYLGILTGIWFLIKGISGLFPL